MLLIFQVYGVKIFVQYDAFCVKCKLRNLKLKYLNLKELNKNLMEARFKPRVVFKTLLAMKRARFKCKTFKKIALGS